MSETPDTLQNASSKLSVFHRIKSWKGYLFEFILLFLAVFLGFLAENYREKNSEQQQAGELARNFYDELLTDSVAIQWYIDARFSKDTALVALKNYVLDSSLEKVSKNYVRNFYVSLFLNSRFEPTTVILDQLKNSGSLLYFRSKELQRLTGSLSECISQMRETDGYDASLVQDQILPFAIAHGDQKFYDKITSDGSMTFGDFIRSLSGENVGIDYHINDVAGFDRKKFNNLLGIYRLRLKTATSHHYLGYRSINKQLLNVLRREYQIK